jgi:ACS family glucarate transporter-like MFS transporter
MPDTPDNGTPQKKTNTRLWIAFMMWLAIAINYFDRGNLSVAIPLMAKEFHLSPAIMGVVLSAFFWPYFLLQIPVGWLADRKGHRVIFTLSVALWSLATAATGLARGTASLVGLRILLGIGESGAYPSAAGVTARWFPDKERSRVSSIFDGGSKFGAAIALPLTAWMVLQFGWRAAFLLSGLVGLIWAVVWWWYYREPEEHKFMNAAELKYIREGQLKREGLGGGQPMKWYELLKYRNIWAMCLGFFTMNYIGYFFYTWFPVYLLNVHKLSLMKMGLIASVPIIISMFAEFAAGCFADYLFSRGWPITRVRKLILISGELLATSIAIAIFAHSIVWAIVLMTLCKSGQTIANSQVWTLPGDVSPQNMTSQVASLQNTVSNLAGVVGPIVTGVILQVTHSFDWALVVIAALAVLGAMNYLFFLGKVEPIQPKPRVAKLADATSAGGPAR